MGRKFQRGPYEVNSLRLSRHRRRIDWVMRRSVGNKCRVIRWTLTSMLEDIDFADDIALLSSNANHL